MNNKIERMEKQVFKIFDSENNRSIMIKDELNDLRNEIMRRTKSH